MAAPFSSFRGLLQSLFDATDAPSPRSPGSWGSRSSRSASPSPSPSRMARASRHSRRSAASDAADDDADADEDARLPYSPRAFDGEYNVWFPRKPLGLGLVPSTQLYGTWEVSSVAPPAPTEDAEDMTITDADGTTHDERSERRKLHVGDVIIAVNFRTDKARLPREAFMAYLTRSACPIVVTLRRPAVYGSFDSRSMVTAMFPSSIEYRGGAAEQKRFHARASSVQWKRNLQHELSKKKKVKKKTPSGTIKGGPIASTPCEKVSMQLNLDPPPQPSSPLPTTADANQDVNAQLNEMGEFTFLFENKPFHLILAPSTRHYGSIEVYDPKVHAPTIQIGDVIMAVNGDASVTRWTTDDAIEHIAEQKAPMTIRFRRPALYREYLERFFRSAKPNNVSSSSLAKAMFPDSAEYKHGNHRHHHHTSARHHEKLPIKSRRESIGQTPSTHTTGTPTTSSLSSKHHSALSKRDWERISSSIAASDQFKLWQSSIGGRSVSSAFLTERHVHFLWKHLPAYLTCNDLELVYDTRRHGWNLLSFYSLLEDRGPTILAIKDSRDQIFGAFSSASWRHSTEVYGNGRSFVFTLRPRMKVYVWSGLNDTFMFGRSDALLMGGGKKGSSLCIQLDELRGYTQPCETFDSPPLTQGSSEFFDIENMEVWCFSGLRI